MSEATILDAEPSGDEPTWLAELGQQPAVDVCHLPAFHRAYATRAPGARARMFRFIAAGRRFLHAFLQTPAPSALTQKRALFDIESAYGYTGPLSNADDPGFVGAAWAAFDDWALGAGVVAEFTRFSPALGNRRLAHPDTEILDDREIAVTNDIADRAALFQALGSKTRNMIRKAMKSGLTFRFMDPATEISAFRDIYSRTMARNAATDFFAYDDTYFRHLLALGSPTLLLGGVFSGDRLAASAIGVHHRGVALYHLGATDPEHAKVGAGNLLLYELCAGMIALGARRINLGGGRTAAPDDPLYGFKRSNAAGVDRFWIGKRIVDRRAYEMIRSNWRAIEQREPGSRLIFYR